MKQTKPTIFSGVQPSGSLHLGNYLGAIARWAELQDAHKCIFCVVDYHAITVKQDPKELDKKVKEVAKIYLASGIDPKKSVIFQQSDIPEHTELTWLLNCVSVRMADLNKMTQFKDKSSIKSYESLATQFNEAAKKMEVYYRSLVKKFGSFQVMPKKDLIESAVFSSDKNAVLIRLAKDMLDNRVKEENVSVGIFDYPVLMASDILLYNTDFVPVGEDQRQHIELTRTIARRFNKEYKNIFKIPKSLIGDKGARIMGLDDPTKKMSKSATSEMNYIALLDKPEVARKKIMKAVTDSEAKVKYDVINKPAISNLLTIYSLLSKNKISITDLEHKYRKSNYGQFKADLADVVCDFLKDFQRKYNKITKSQVETILKSSANKIRPIAQQITKKAREAVGIK